IAEDVPGVGAHPGDLVGLVLLGEGIGALFWGFLFDRFGFRKIIIPGCLAYIIASFVVSVTHDYTLFVIARLLHGIALSWIYVVGYAMGSMAALHAAALDPRIAGVVAVAGVTPMRTDTADKGTGGVARWAQWLPLIPRLGAFVGHEEKIPYDYEDLLGLIAPRPVVLLQPNIDYLSTPADVQACVAAAQKIYALYDRPAALRLVPVDDYNRYSRKVADEVVRQLKLLDTP
ncbi:MAG: MFS transporter, partial [Verrucomicrobia bacterium]|nr:MFS transporter [Verrucomicrobiota bacterium]